MSDTIIQLDSLEVGYKKAAISKALFPPVSLTVNAGEFVAIVGPNGAGKSTFLRTLAGLQPPLGGEVKMKGQPLQRLSLKMRSKLLSIVLTDYPDDFYLKAKDVVASGRYPYTDFWANLTADDDHIILKSMQSCGVLNLRDRRLISLSDGERQKVMIAKALAQDTPLIIMDEPAAFLDYPSKIDLMHLLLRLTREERKTILFSSHDLDLVLRSADRIWLMAPDKALTDGMPEELVLSSAINAYFDKSDLKFNAQLGHFTSSVNNFPSIHVKISEPIKKKWVCSALLRSGFNPSDEDNRNNIAEIDYKSGTYLLTINNDIMYYPNLSALIHALTNDI